MYSFSSFIIALLSFGAAWLGYSKTHSILLAVVLFLAVVMIGKTLQPIFLRGWDKFRRKCFPAPELTEFFSANFPEDGKATEDVGGNGLRVLAVTETLRPNAKQKPLYLDMVTEAMAALRETSPLFALRLDAVKTRALPELYVAALCDKNGKKMRKCFRTWMRSEPLRCMRYRAVNKDLFLHDGTITVPGQTEPLRYTVLVLFDGTLPSTLPAAE